MIKFVSYTNVNPTVEPASNVLGSEFRKIIRQPEDDVSVETLPEDALAEVLPEVITRPTTRRFSIDTSSLLSTDIEDIFRQAGLTTINGKKIKFGNKALRAQNASFGARNSNHKKRDPHTGNAMARDISIIGGTLDDYAEFRRQIMSNDLISKYMDAKGWGIINEVTPQILARTGGTGPHFHFGPDTWARRTWQAWKNNPNAPITQAFKQGGGIRKFQNAGKIDWNQVGEYAKIGASFLPYIGSAMDVKEAWDNPTWGNIGMAALSLGTDVLGLSLLRGGIKATKAVKTAVKAYEAGLKRVKTIKKSINNLLKAKSLLSNVPPQFRNTYAQYIDDAIAQALGLLKRANFDLFSLLKNLLRVETYNKDIHSVPKSLPYIIYVKGPDFFTNTMQLFEDRKIENKKQGGRFTFKRNQMIKDAEQLNGKKDMRKKLVKSDVVTNKKNRVKKGLEGLKFATYTPIETPLYEPDEISNPFSEYNFPTQYKEVLVERPLELEVAVEAEPVKQETSKQLKVSAPKVTTLFGSRKDFVNTLYSHLYKALQENGIDAKTWAPILTAHTSIESGWGNKFSRKNNNFGGIKGKGSGMVKTKEYSPERGYYTINDSFKSYASIDDFANDYVKILKNMGAFNGTPDLYLANLKKHRYFTARLEDYLKMFNSRLRTVNSLLSS